LLHIDLLTEPAYKLRFTPDDRKNAAEIKQVARLDTFNISAKRSVARAATQS
jgi:hypothetical protein